MQSAEAQLCERYNDKGSATRPDNKILEVDADGTAGKRQLHFCFIISHGCNFAPCELSV